MKTDIRWKAHVFISGMFMFLSHIQPKEIYIDSMQKSSQK